MSDIFDPTLTGVSLAISVSAYGYLLDGKISRTAKRRLYEMLKESSGRDELRNLLLLFLRFFDRVFRTQRFLRPSVRRSVAASGIVFVSLLVIWYFISPERVHMHINQIRKSEIQIISLVICSVNFVGDFASLWGSRYILGLVQRVQSSIASLGLLLLDLVMSIFIYMGALFLSLCLWWIIIEFPFQDPYGLSFYGIKGGLIWGLWKIWTNDFFFGYQFIFPRDNSNDVFAICFYSTLFTSVWVWSCVLGRMVWPLFDWLRNFIDTEKYPIGVCMTMGGICLGTVTAIIGYLS